SETGTTSAYQSTILKLPFDGLLRKEGLELLIHNADSHCILPCQCDASLGRRCARDLWRAMVQSCTDKWWVLACSLLLFHRLHHEVYTADKLALLSLVITIVTDH